MIETDIFMKSTPEGRLGILLTKDVAGGVNPDLQQIANAYREFERTKLDLRFKYWAVQNAIKALEHQGFDETFAGYQRCE